jgi:hydroxymethylglutaryl-CoA lyase
MKNREKVTVFEVGPRDGLQNEPKALALATKIKLISDLRGAGVRMLEAGAFVRGDKVPQMAESEKVAESFQSDPEMYYLVPNEKGFARAQEKGVKAIALFTAVSETFNQKNIGMSVEESFRQMENVARLAKASNLKVRGYVSTVWGCPFEGRISPKAASPILERVLSLPVDELSIGDTIGVAVPAQVDEIVRGLPMDRVALHFHDTRGTALANVLRGLELGVRRFDSSLGGLGGCPFAPGAAGNLATEDLVYLLKESGFDTGIDYVKLCKTSLELFQALPHRQPTSKALLAYIANCTKNTAWDS